MYVYYQHLKAVTETARSPHSSVIVTFTSEQEEGDRWEKSHFQIFLRL